MSYLGQKRTLADRRVNDRFDRTADLGELGFDLDYRPDSRQQAGLARFARRHALRRQPDSAIALLNCPFAAAGCVSLSKFADP